MSTHSSAPESRVLTQELIDAASLEAHLRFEMITVLYKNKRENPLNAGMTMLQIQTAIGIDQEQLFFASWYLRTKQLILLNDRSIAQITVEGVDYFEQMMHQHKPARPGYSDKVVRA